MGDARAVQAALKANRSEDLRCGSVDRRGHQCQLSRGHAFEVHVFVTHTVTDHQGQMVPGSLGWAEWTTADEMVCLPTKPCPHKANDRASCRTAVLEASECDAWRLAIIEWAMRGRRPGTLKAKAEEAGNG